MIGNQFVDIADGESGILLENLKGDFADADIIEIASCDPSGVVGYSTYQYFTEEGVGLPDGWYSSEGPAVDVAIPHGSAVWFTSSSGDPKPVTTSGAIYSGDDGVYTHHFTDMVSLVCSAFPVPFAPNDTTRVTWDGLMDADMIEVAACNASGVVSYTSYQYFTEEGVGLPDGWYSTEGMVEGAVVEASKGFWLTMADPTNVTLVEKSPVK